VPAKRRALAERREILGYSQETLARILGVEPTTVGRWERGETSPQPWTRPKLADALTISVEDLDTLLTNSAPPAKNTGDPVLSAPWDHRGTVEAAVALRGGGPVQRRRFLFLTGATLTAPAHQWLIHEPGPLESGLAGRRVSATLADRLPAMITELRTLDDIAGGGTVLSLARHDFDWVADLLDHAGYDQPTGRKLHVALAELGQLAGWGAYDNGQPALAQRYNIAALRAAHSAGDRPLGAHVLGSMAKQAAHQGRAAEAVTLAETALTSVREWQTPRLLAELHLRHAYALGKLGDASGCMVAISKATAQLDKLDSDDDPAWLYWVTSAWITVEAGDSLLQSEQPDRAAPMLDEGVGLFTESFVRDRQIYSLHLAEALARPGRQRDLEAAADRGMAALDFAENLHSTLSSDLLHDLHRQMKPHAKVPAVRDFLDRARELVDV
jgi:transcriptional regulator with XRE-family HTH domain